MPSVIFVCTGNLHRSPMAEYLFRDKIGAEPGWEISSAGTYTRNGLPTNDEVLLTLKKYGIDASNHRSKIITRRKLANHNLVLCLASNHKEALQVEFPDLKDRIYLLSEMVGKTASIKDPIGGPLVEYEAVAREIDGYLTEGFERIVELASEKQK
jgi:protein-tyrosine phosphatase